MRNGILILIGQIDCRPNNCRSTRMLIGIFLTAMPDQYCRLFLLHKLKRCYCNQQILSSLSMFLIRLHLGIELTSIERIKTDKRPIPVRQTIHCFIVECVLNWVLLRLVMRYIQCGSRPHGSTCNTKAPSPAATHEFPYKKLTLAHPTLSKA